MAQKNRIKANDDIKNDLKSVSSKKKKVSGTKYQNIVDFFLNDKVHQVFGAFLIAYALFSLTSCISYLYYWKYDDNLINNSVRDILFSNELVVKNWMSKLGALNAHLFIKKGFGVASLIFPFLFFIYGLKLLFNIRLLPIARTSRILLIAILWLSFVLGFSLANTPWAIFGGTFGNQLSYWLVTLLGKIGTIIAIVLSFVSILILEFNVSFRNLKLKQRQASEREPIEEDPEKDETEEMQEDNVSEEDSFLTTLFKKNNYIHEPKGEELSDERIEQEALQFEIKRVEPKPIVEPKIETPVEFSVKPTSEETLPEPEKETIELPVESTPTLIKTEEKGSTLIQDGLEIIVPKEEVIADIDEIELQSHYTIDMPFDPRLDLSSFKLPTVDLLEDYSQSAGNMVLEGELHTNKDRILETLKNYNIGIDKISATIGPTVTLYEIVPAPGVRISKIKNLEDDIALSLSALGIRIIAPIPGKGTIGIEVPNSNPEIVPMRAVLSSEKFVNSKFDLPIGLGKTISNESFIYDLAKMPHLLMAGATGQGKSVGLNAIVASLLFKKHPAELKFVMVDPKKVELTLFSKIERHYLAKLPDAEDAIITDTKKVVRTLNSLCIEMDTRYDLLKDAQCRNIKEYNAKYISRRLNPNDGHRFLPYIVLIVDEFADLIMTAGKEVETPIARLAQLARAIGIHLIIATQRPSVNIITGTIKANFPARVAFRVTSKIDSRTILDSSGAEQLIGRGDMLLSTGNDLIRIQCAFIDTPEVEKVTEYIGNQRGYADAFILPEVPDEDGDDSVKSFDPNDRDPMFIEAARLIVQSQHGSTSLIQRKLKLGYNRAGRIIDQLEGAGIVGPFEGSKAREVRFKDEFSLEQYLRDNNL
jgi:S-DNA-T family DNA segregation ATPase FtsK/SpoIIIE